MRPSRETILADVIELLLQLAEEYDFERSIDETTRLVADLGFASLEVVVLGTAVQEHYGQAMPFPEFFAEIGQREVQDVTVGEWVSFIHSALGVPSPLPSQAEVPS